MELLDGVPLRSLLDGAASEPWSTAQSFAVLRAAGDALTYAHAKGAVHGDLKLENLFVTTDREIKVLDLLPASSPRTEASFVEDAAPNSLASPDRRDDVFGLASIAYELLAGQRPYDGRSALEAANAGLALAPSPRLDARQWDAIARGLALRREDRTKTVAAGSSRSSVSRTAKRRSPRATRLPTRPRPSPPTHGHRVRKTTTCRSSATTPATSTPGLRGRWLQSRRDRRRERGTAGGASILKMFTGTRSARGAASLACASV